MDGDAEGWMDGGVDGAAEAVVATGPGDVGDVPDVPPSSPLLALFFSEFDNKTGKY